MEQCTEEEVRRLVVRVPELRRQKALAFKSLLGRYTCLKSYVMLHGMLVERGLIAEDNLPDFEYGVHGKPRLRGMDWVHFSLSHTRCAIAVGVDNRPVGVDVEGFRQPTDVLLEYTMDAEEARRVKQAEHPEREFALLWTQKEALVKYTGLGINGSLKGLLATLPEGAVLQSDLNTAKGYALTVVRAKG